MPRKPTNLSPRTKRAKTARERRKNRTEEERARQNEQSRLSISYLRAAKKIAKTNHSQPTEEACLHSYIDIKDFAVQDVILNEAFGETNEYIESELIQEEPNSDTANEQTQIKEEPIEATTSEQLQGETYTGDAKMDHVNTQDQYAVYAEHIAHRLRTCKRDEHEISVAQNKIDSVINNLCLGYFTNTSTSTATDSSVADSVQSHSELVSKKEN